ncbi:PASTA domain-containing protein [Burkholderiales bacterium JOSHI_001]|nr:PASTA domain-containing protein [Burkholderiales bacterium JOSHI_001]
MAEFDDTLPLLDALSAPIGDLIAAVGRGVADAQRAMDEASLATLSDVYARGDGLLGELQRIGYRPNWYHIPEVESELQIALTISGERTRGAGSTGGLGGGKLRLYAAPVDAGYSSRFNFQLQASSKVKFKIVSIPPSNAADALQAMPALVGLPLGEARARLRLLGITGTTVPAEGGDTLTVTTQQPAPGTLLGNGSAVQVSTNTA